MTENLNGLNILITRAQIAAQSMITDIERCGGQSLVAPVMTFQPLSLTTDEKQKMKKLEQYQWVMWTSANGVRFFMEHLKQLSLSLPKEMKFAVVGEKTARALKDYGYSADFIPEVYTAESLAEGMGQEPSVRILLPVGKLARDNLGEKLRKIGFSIERLNVYDTLCNEAIKPRLHRLILDNAIDVVTFASPSAVRFFLILTQSLDMKLFWQRVVVACIGKVTAEEVEHHGLTAHIVSAKHTASALLQAIARYKR